MKKIVFHSQFTAIATGMLLTPANEQNRDTWLRVAGGSGAPVGLWLTGRLLD